MRSLWKTILPIAPHVIAETGRAESGMNRFDPRGRIIAAVLFAVVVASLDAIGPLCLGLLAAGALLLISALPLWGTLKRMVMMDAFVIVIIVLLPFTVAGTPLFTVGGFPASAEGLAQAGRIALKANAIVLTLMALVGSMEPTTLGHALSRLRVPGALVQLMLFMVRYIDVIHQEYAQLRTAMVCRAFRPRSNLHTYRSYGYLVGMLLVRALDRSERIVGAMKCRGFTGTFVIWDDMKWHRRDTVFILCCVVALAGLCLWEFADALFV